MEFTEADLRQIAAKEGSKTYTFSHWNTFPTFKKSSVTGPTVRGILERAGAMDAVTDSGIVSFTDGAYKMNFTGRQLFGEKRFFYPAGSLVDQLGGVVPEAAYEGAEEIEPVITLDDEEEDPTLYFGQATPNEENKPAFVHYLTTINVTSEEPSPCDAVTGTEPEERAYFNKGQQVILKWNKKNNQYVHYAWGKDSIPDHGSPIYNSGGKQDLDCIPVLPDKYGTYYLNTIVEGYGRLDSEIRSFEINVVPEMPGKINVAAASYNSARLTWSKVEDAKSYRIYRSAGSSAPVLYKEVGANTLTLTDTGLATGTAYNYQVSATDEDEDGQVFESRRTAKVQVKTSLAKPSLKLKAGKRKATVRWSKISGANGYVIYRSTKKTKGYKAIKTIKKGSTVKLTDKKLKKGKKYYYKVRAYRNVGGRKVYSSYSAVKYIKAK